MGAFGTTPEEEAKLRNAAALNRHSTALNYTTDTSTSQSFHTADAESVGTDNGFYNAQSRVSSSISYVSCEPGNSQHVPPVDHTAGDVSAPQTAGLDTTKAAAPTHAIDADRTADAFADDQTISNSVKDYIVEDTNGPEQITDENALNKKYSLERQQSRKLFDESVHSDMDRLSSHKPLPSSSELTNSDAPIHLKDLDWDSPQDPENPQNWPAWKKWYITITTAIVCLCCSLGLSLFVAGTFDLMVEFNASQELCLLGLTFYLIGLAFGPVISAPLSEIFGRRWIYIVSLPILMLFTMGVGLANNMRTILVLRFFVGYSALPALSIAGGTISDLWANDPIDMSLAMTIFCLAPFLGPVIGPVIGGYAAEYKNWKWPAAWVLMMFSGAILPFVLFCPETYKPIILRKRAAARGLNIIKEPYTKEKGKLMAKYILLLPMKMLFTDTIVLVMSIYIAFVFAVLFGFFEAFPVIFRGTYHMSLGNLGLPFIGVGLGLCFGVLFYAVLDRFYFFPKNPDGTRGKRDAEGNIVWDPPETKLLAGKVGAVCLPVALFWMGWTARHSVHWMAPTAAGFPFGFGLILVFFSVVLYFGMSFPPMYVALALAANNFLRYIVASVFPLFTVQMYQRLGTGWASSLFAFIALAMVPVPFVYQKFGPKLRARSEFGYAAYFRKVQEAKAAAEAEKAASHADEKDAANDQVNPQRADVASAMA